MEKPAPALLILSFFILGAGTITGSLLALKLAGDAAGYGAILFGSIIASLIFLLQVMLYRMIRNRLFFSIVFLATFSLTLVWFMINFFMPILWMDTMPAYAKFIVSSIFLVLCLANFLKGRKDLLCKWPARSDVLRIGMLEPIKGTIAWGKIVQSLKLEPNLYIPGLPSKFSNVVGMSLAIFMLIGFNFRTAFPVFSAFAWGIPSAMVTSFFFQVMGQKVGEAEKVRELQAELKVDLQST